MFFFRKKIVAKRAKYHEILSTFTYQVSQKPIQRLVLKYSDFLRMGEVEA
jgi:hypothetical protein